MFDYDEPARVAALRRLSPRLQVAWALLCAERALPGYRRFHRKTGRGDPFAAEALAERLWFDVAGDPMTGSELETALGRAEQLLIDADDGLWSEPTQYNADDATAALFYALAARAHADPQLAAFAGRRLYELADHLAQRALGDQVSARTWTMADEVRLLAHPLVQHELARQEGDLRDLAELGDDAREVLETMKARAASDAADLLPA